MKCSSCNRQLGEYDVVCPHCGASTGNVVPAHAETSADVTVMTPPKKLKAGLFAVLAVVSAVVLLVLLAFFVASLGHGSSVLDASAKTVGDTVFFSVPHSIVRRNTATGETMASHYTDDGAPVSFAVSGNTVWYVAESALWRCGFSLNDGKIVISGVSGAALYNGTVYYVSSENPAQLRACGENGGGDRLVTLIYDDREPVSSMAVSEDAVYILKGASLYRYDIKNESVETVFSGDKPAVSLAFFKNEGAVVYTDGINRLRMIGKNGGDYGVSVSAAAVSDGRLFGVTITDTGFNVGKINVNNGSVSELCKKDGTGLSVAAFSADMDYLCITVTSGEMSSLRCAVYRVGINNGVCEELFNDLG